MAYSPASVVTGAGLPNSLATFYDRTAIEPLFANTPFLDACTKRPLPINSGKTMQLFGYNILSANTTQSTEGTVGSGEVLTSADSQVTLGQYTDFASFSDMIVATAIDPIVENAAKVLGNQAALSINSLVQQEFDAAITNDPTANDVPGAGVYLTAGLIRQRVADLQGRNAHALADGQYAGFIHPFVASDLLNDTSNNGFVDIAKRNPEGVKLLTSATPDSTNYEILGDFGGVRWVSTTTCPTYSGVPASGDTAYGTYIVAKDAVFAVSLGATELPGDKNFKLLVSQFQPSVADPALQIRAAVAWNVKCAFAIRPGTVSLVERIQAQTQTT
jgi:N4-gp56 family major capsid protein